MPKKETYSAHIECKKCNVNGQATWEENENPVHGGGYDKRLLSVSEGFSIEANNKMQ